MTPDELLRARPVSAQWRRILLERLDAVAVVYRLASAVSNVAHPIRFRWFRAMPMDAAITLPDGRVIAVVRQGLTSDQTGFSKRLWRLWQGPQPSAVLMLMPDDVRLRHARRLAAGAPAIVFLALERDAASAARKRPRVASAVGVGGPRPADRAVVREAARRMAHRGASGAGIAPRTPHGRWPGAGGPRLPAAHAAQARREARPRPARRLALDNTRRPRRSTRCEAVAALAAPRAARRAGPRGRRRRRDGRRRLALADRGLALLARRDRAAVGVARKRWSVAPLDSKAPLTWRNVSGLEEQTAAAAHRTYRGGAWVRRERWQGRPAPRVGR